MNCHRRLSTVSTHTFGFKPLLGFEPMAPIHPQLPTTPNNHSATKTSLNIIFNKPMIYVDTKYHAVHHYRA